MKMPLKTIASVALLMLPALSFALGLGDINVKTKLNEPLRAEIRLLYSDADEIESTEIALASPEDFERVGLDSSVIPFDLNFEVQRNEDGDFVVLVTSELPISEPFLDFLVEVNWANGRLLREYVVLLDPPVVAPASGPAVTGISEQPTPAPTPTTSPTYPDDDDQPVVDSTTDTQPISYPSSDTYGPVASGDTLWEISRDWRPSGDISINQMMVMLHQMNPDAFYQDNINALKRGAILRMPSAEDFSSLNQTAATREVKSQNEMWESYRLTAATRTPTVSDAGVSPEYDSGVSAISSDDSRLELVPPAGDAGSDVDYGEGSYALQAEVSDLRSDLQRTREDLLSATQENSDLTSRVADLEDLVSNLETAITLKDADLADLQVELELAREGLTSINSEVDSGYDYDTGSDATTADTGFDDAGYDDADDSYADTGTTGFDDSSTDPITTSVDDTSLDSDDTSLDSGIEDTIPDTADVAVTTPPPVVTTPPPARESKSMVMALMTNPFVIGGLAVIFLGVGAFVWQRRRQAAAGESLIDAMMEEEYAAPEPIPMPTPPPEPEPQPEAFAETVASPMMSEDSLINAIQTNPGDPQAHLALLRMYYSEGQKDKFLGAAEKMQDHIGGTSHPAWAEVKGMGSTLAPEHTLFGGSSESADDDSPGLDLQGSSVADSDDDDEFSLDLDLSDDSGESSSDAGLDLSMDTDDDSDDEFSLDLDMDESDGPSEGTDADDDDLSLDFDSVSDDGDQEAESPTDTAEELEGLEFDLDAADMPDAEESKVGEHTEFELEAVSDGEDSGDQVTADAPDDDDLGLGDIDFDIDLDSGDETAAADADSAGDSELDALAQTDISDLGLDDLDLDEETLSGNEDSVGTKLDLARAYIEMGDPDGARGMLDEVVSEGSEKQVEEAQKLLSDLG